MAVIHNGRFTLLLAALLIAIGPRLAGAQTSDLVAAFAFNEGVGATAADASGRNHTGVISGARWTTGRFGGALLFDGINDMATVLDSPLLDLTTAMTIEAWVYPTSNKDDGDDGWGAVVLKDGATDPVYALYGVGRNGRPTATIATPAEMDVRAGSDPPLHTWSHIAATFDGATLRLYVNGVQVATRARSGSIRTSANPLRIGGASIGSEYFPGRIDEVRIYRRALTATEIRLDMLTPITPLNSAPADTTPPSVSISSPANGTTVASTIAVTASATDDRAVAGVQFLLDGLPLGPEDTSSPYSVTWATATAADAIHVLSARARDAAGHTSVASSVLVTVDNILPDLTPPAITLTGPADGAQVSGTVLAAANASDDVAVVAVQFLLDGLPLGPEDTSSPYAVTWDTRTSTNTAHTLSARARDAAGNVSVLSSVLVSVANPPTLTITRPSPGVPIQGAIVDVQYTTAGDLTGVAYVHFRLDDGSVAMDMSLDGVFQFTDVAAGSHVVNGYLVRSDHSKIDATDAQPVSFTTAMPDLTPPAITLTSPAGGAEVSGSIVAAADASDDLAVVAVQFLLDGVPLGPEDTSSPYTVTWDTRTATNTTHTLSARARDAAGNGGIASGVLVTVANPPKLTITRPAAGTSIQGAVVDVQYTTEGDLTGVDHVHFRLDDRSVVMDMSFDGVYRLTNVAPGSHVLNGHLVRSDHSKIDGTDAQPVSFTTVMPDVTPPAITLTGPADGGEVSGLVTVAADAADDTAVAAVQFLLDGSDLGARDTAAPFAVSWETAGAANGPHALSAVAYDSSGNATASEARAVTVANLDPAAQTGKWSTVMNWPLVAVHATLMHTGQVLLWDGWEAPALATVWNPATNSFTSVPNQSGLFCSAHSMLPDGRILVTGGHAGGEVGIVDVNSFDPVSRAWKIDANMRSPRWYPSSTTLGDGRVVVLSGQIRPGTWADTPELYDPATGAWTRLSGINTSDVHDSEYLLTTLLPDGRIAAIAASTGQVRVLDIAKSTWTDVGSNPKLLKTSAAMFRPGQILATGGGETPGGSSEARASLIDFNDPAPAWREIAPMAYPRFNHNMLVLPDGAVLAVGGSTIVNQTSTTGTLAAELWNPVTESWQTLASMRDPRMYHSIALLLPDGRVLSAGGGRLGGARDYFTAEIFSPPYLFKGTRPSILSAPSVLPLGSTATIQTANAADIATVSMIRLASVTHTLDMDQRYLPLDFTAGPDRLTITAPASAELAPPGYYMVFIVNSRGVPSTAAILRVPSPQEDVQAPLAPQNLTATGGLSTATLTWDAASDDSGVTAYNVHRAPAPGFVPSPQNRVARVAGPGFTDFVASGIYSYVVTAEDAAGNVSEPSNEAIASVTSDTTPPAVGITQPAIGATVSGEVTVSAGASDDVAVVSVRFFVDGVVIGSEAPDDTVAPYSATWNTRTSANGTYVLTAVARDANGNETRSAPVTVSVNNVTAAGLVAAFGFEEGAGTTVADGSGFGNAGTVSGAAWAAGRFGRALSFDGINDMVTVLDSPSLDLSSGMTLEAWVNPRGLSGYVTVAMKERPGHLAYALYASTDTSRASAEIAVVTNLDTRSVAPLALNLWNHVAATFDGTTLRLFVNGVQVSTRAITGTIMQSSNPLRIGGNLVWGEYFNGLIDEVRIYNRPLTALEIQGDMKLAVTP